MKFEFEAGAPISIRWDRRDGDLDQMQQWKQLIVSLGRAGEFTLSPLWIKP